MAIIRCKMCGCDLDITQGQLTTTCEACGTRQTLPKINDEAVQNLFNRANALRLKCEFDKAEQVYEKIVEIDNTEAEAHWGIVLCKYGIEYVEDPKNFQRVPTCHRTSFEAITADAEYLAALQYADVVQKGIYEKEAHEIDRLQKNILQIVRNEKPFDVFICYKESDEFGKRTVDSVIANDIYHQLTQEGMKVFYAAITLEDKLGTAYEPYIFAALNSAKVMLVIGTKPQYFSAVWVKNEWSRFLKLMKSDHNRLLIPCYRDMDPYDLPDEFAHLQAQDMNKIGFINDIVRGIRKVVVKQEAVTAAPAAPVVAAPVAGNAAALLKRANIFLEDGDWKSADEYCEKVLDIDPENAEAYLGKLMAELRVNKQEDLKNQANTFEDWNYYKKAIRYADDALADTLRGYNTFIKQRNETAQLDAVYNSAMEKLNQARSRSMGTTAAAAFREAAKQFDTIRSYKDAAELADSCRTDAKKSIYGAGKSKINNAKSCEDYDEAEKLFGQIPGYLDADELRQQASQKVKEIIYKQGCDSMKQDTLDSYTNAINKFEKIPGYLDADVLKKQCKAAIIEINRRHLVMMQEKERNEQLARQKEESHKRRNKMLTFLGVIAAIAAVAIFITVLVTVIIPSNKYKEAVQLYENGEYKAAFDLFLKHSDYKDSKAQAYACAEKMEETSEKYAAISFGKLGDYEDSHDRSMALWNKFVKRQYCTTETYVGYPFAAVTNDGLVMVDSKFVERSEGAITANGSCATQVENIVSVVITGYDCVTCLKEDGTVTSLCYKPLCSYCGKTAEWDGVVDIVSTEYAVYGLRKDGTVLAFSTYGGTPQASKWADVVNIVADGDDSGYVAAIKADGTVLVDGVDDDVAKAVAGWTDIVDVDVGDWTVVGLKADGSVVVACSYDSDQSEAQNWANVVEVACSRDCVFGITADGELLATKNTIPSNIKGIHDWAYIEADASDALDDFVAVRKNGELFENTSFDIEGWTNIKTSG